MLAITPPIGASALFRERVDLRLRELASDLELDSVPAVAWLDADAPAIRLGGEAVPLPLSPRSAAKPSAEPEEAVAERVAAALIRHRWALLEAALQARGVPRRQALADLSVCGLGLSALEALHREAPSDDAALALVAATSHPPRVELLLNRGDGPGPLDDGFLKAAAQSTATSFGLPVPVPELRSDAGLDEGRFRLRCGAVRGPVQPEAWPTAPEAALHRALIRHAPSFLDTGALLSLLLNPHRVPSEMARSALQLADAPSIAAALRVLLADGIGLVDPLLICDAITAPTAVIGNPSDFAIAMPGVLILAETALEGSALNLAERMRARLVPAHLLRHSAASLDPSRREIQMWSLSGSIIARLRSEAPDTAWANRFAAAAAVIPDYGILVVPAGLRSAVRRLLTDPLPDLLIVDGRELPPGSRPHHRGTIKLGAGT